MNLSRARLCLDCETLHECAACPNCASSQWSLIVKWLSRTATPTNAVARTYAHAEADHSRQVTTAGTALPSVKRQKAASGAGSMNATI